jgi:hypothetical protein
MKSFYLLPLSALIAPVLCGSVKFNGCSSSQEEIIRLSLSDVELISKAATKESEGGRGKFHAWFGAEGTIKDESINTRYHKFSSASTSVPKKDLTFDCTGTSRCCKAGLGGYVLLSILGTTIRTRT